MTSTSPAKHHALAIIGFLIALSAVVIASELVYQLSHNPRFLVYGYFNNVPVSSSQSQLAKRYNETVAKSFYIYFSHLDKLYPTGAPCSPFCLQYYEEQTYLDLFKSLLTNDALGALTDSQKGQLYFWMADINIWHQNDQTTLDWLKEGLSLRESDNYREFYKDLRDLNKVEEDPEIREYFIYKLSVLEADAPRSERIYLAKASYNLAQFFLNTQSLDQAEGFIQKSVSLNPWNIDYYLLHAKVLLNRDDLEGARETLKNCVEQNPNDSTICRDELIYIDQKEFLGPEE